MDAGTRELLRRHGDCLLLVSAGGVVTYATRQALAILGLEGPDVVDRPLSDVAGALRSEALARAAELAGSGERVVRTMSVTSAAGAPLDCVLLPADEGTAMFVAHAHANLGAYGSPPAVAMIDKVLGSIRDAVLVTTAEPVASPGPVIVYANEALTHHTGYSIDELLGRSPRILQGPETDYAQMRRLRESLDHWTPVTVEALNYRKDGSTFWVEMDITPVADETGWFTHWVSVQRDVTARHEAEERERERGATVQAILDSMPSQTAMLDPDGRIVAVNQPWRDYWARGSEQPEPDWTTVNYLDACDRAVPLTDFGTLVALSDPERAAEGIRTVLRRDAPSFEMDYECIVGSELYWFRMNVLPLTGRAGAVITHTDITERKQSELRLAQQATHDDLTGLPNRLQATRALQRELDANDGSAVAVIFVGLDNFKDVNYAHGHAAGDQMLKVIAERLLSLAIDPELVARFGGDEFVLILRDLDSTWRPESYLTDVRELLAAPIPLESVTLRPSTSFGVVTSPAYVGDAEAAEAMLRDADTAAYTSKSAGRDRWTVFSDDIRRAALVRATSEQRIVQALASGDFLLYFQPVIDLATLRTVGSEALLRLREPDGTVLTPAYFLPIVESGPLAEEVGLWVLNRAMSVQARWLRNNPDHRMSVNVSPRQFGHGRLPEQVASALLLHDVPASTLVLEITEDLALAENATVAEELAELERMGVRIAMDDFGTGYSSLANLQRLPIQILKIDRTFLALDPAGEALLSSIVSLARDLKATAIIEGVESLDHLDLARRVGASRAQGFLLGLPQEAGTDPASVPATLLAMLDD